MRRANRWEAPSKSRCLGDLPGSGGRSGVLLWVRNFVERNTEVGVADTDSCFPDQFEMYLGAALVAAGKGLAGNEGYFVGEAVIDVDGAIDAGNRDAPADEIAIFVRGLRRVHEMDTLIRLVARQHIKPAQREMKRRRGGCCLGVLQRSMGRSNSKP